MTEFLKKARHTYALLLLLKLRGRSEKFGISTTQIAKIANMSQQSASRLLVELEREGLVRRERGRGRTVISLTDKALEEFNELVSGIALSQQVSTTPIEVRGIVFSGMSEGAYYMSQKAYASQFLATLGFRPYPGTLNVRLTDPKDVMNFAKILAKKPSVIKGFRDQERTFGDVLSYSVMIEGKVKGSILRSVRTVYDATVAELVAPVQLRKEFSLKDGDPLSFSYG